MLDDDGIENGVTSSAADSWSVQMLCSFAKSMDPGAEATLLVVTGDAPLLLVLGLEPAVVLRDFADPTALLVGPDSSEVCAKKPVCGELQYSGGGCAKKHEDAISK